MTASSDSAVTSPWSGTPRNLFSLKDAPWRWAAGVQAALANALPMVVFYLSGHLSLGIISSLGSFTVLYGTTMRLRVRVRVLPLVATAFITASVLGVLCSGSAGLMFACVVIVALAASILVLGLGLGPPGPMQFVLVSCVSARVAAATRVAAPSLNPNLIPVLVAVGALSAYVVVAAPIALSFGRSDLGNTSAPEPLFDWSRLDAGKLLITARVALAVAAAAIVGLLFRAGHAYWIIIVAGAVLQATWVSRDSAVRAVHRILGTLAGVAVFGLIRFFGPRGGWHILVLVILQFAIELVVARHYALALTFITPTALTIAASAAKASGLVEERIVDTILGALIALVVLLTTNWYASDTEHQLCATAYPRRLLLGWMPNRMRVRKMLNSFAKTTFQ